MSRLNCAFCIMSSKQDRCTAARLLPALAKQYAELEYEIGHTMNMDGKMLEEVTGLNLLDDEVRIAKGA